MPRAPLLIDAARQRDGEVKLTALMACAAESSPAFCRRLMAAGGLDKGHVEALPGFEVSVEVAAGGLRRADLEIIGLNDRRRVAARLWCENKLGADFQPGQLPAYQAALDAKPGLAATKKLAVIARPGRVDIPLGPWEILTWQEIAVAAWEAGAFASGLAPGWREKTAAPGASAEARLLHELLTYLDDQGEAVADPLRQDHLTALNYADEASNVITGLLERAAEFAGPDLTPRKTWDWRPNDSIAAYWQTFESHGWARREADRYPELLFDIEGWARPCREQPAFFMGYTLPADDYDALRDTARAEWASALQSHEFRIDIGQDGCTRLGHTLYAGELPALGSTFDEQAEELARRLKSVTAFLADHDPGLAGR